LQRLDSKCRAMCLENCGW